MGCLEGLANVRFASLADVTARPRDVRFTPQSGHVRCKNKCPLCANSGRCTASLDQCVCPQQKLFWNRKAYGLRRLEINDQFELGGLLNGNVFRRLAL
jgi:hypothetical protein